MIISRFCEFSTLSKSKRKCKFFVAFPGRRRKVSESGDKWTVDECFDGNPREKEGSLCVSRR